MSSIVSDALEARVASRARLRRRRRRQHYGLVLLFLSPWIIGFCAFFLYPMVASLYYSFTQLRPAVARRAGSGSPTTASCSPRTRCFWQSVRNTLWIIVIGVPLRLVFAIFTAMLLTAPRAGVELYRTIFFLPTMVPPVAADARVRVPPEPGTGPSTRSSAPSCTAGSRCGSRIPPTSKPGLVLLGLWGVGDTMIIFLAGLLDVPRSCTRRRTSRAPTPGSGSGTSRCR